MAAFPTTIRFISELFSFVKSFELNSVSRVALLQHYEISNINGFVKKLIRPVDCRKKKRYTTILLLTFIIIWIWGIIS